MVIKNRLLGKILIKLFHLNPHRIKFLFEVEYLDGELTELAFLNQTKGKFEIWCEECMDILDEAIQKAR